MTDNIIKSLREVSDIRNQEQILFDAINKQSNITSIGSHDYPLDSWANSDPSINQNDLRKQYEEALSLAAEELRRVSECLDKVRAQLKRRRTDSNNNLINQSVRSSQGGKSGTTSSSVPSKKSKVQGSSSEWWVHDPTNPLKHGMQVAALIEADSDPQMWILAGVLTYKNSLVRPRYHVIDLDPGEETLPGAVKPPAKTYELDPKRIIPLPSFTDVPLSKRKEIVKGPVLALFPVGGVTTFYEAVVVAGPKKRKDDKYTLIFHDDNNMEREVSAQYVIPWPGRVGDD